MGMNLQILSGKIVSFPGKEAYSCLFAFLNKGNIRAYSSWTLGRPQTMGSKIHNNKKPPLGFAQPALLGWLTADHLLSETKYRLKRVVYPVGIMHWESTLVHCPAKYLFWEVRQLFYNCSCVLIEDMDQDFEGWRSRKVGAVLFSIK